MPNIPLMSKPAGGADGAGSSDKKPEKMNLGRMAKVLGILFLSMSVVVLCELVMPKPAESHARSPAAAMYAPNMAALRPWGYVVIHQLPSYDATVAAGGGERSPTSPAASSDGRSGGAVERGGYHFVIGSGTGGLGDGQAQATPLWVRQQSAGSPGARARAPDAIQIALVGDFTRVEPTAAQMDALVKLVAALQGRFRIPAEHVLLHRELEAVNCPGPRFSASQFLRRLCDFSRTALNS
jgi:hypothetical protein